jgi:hypothetical protein
VTFNHDEARRTRFTEELRKKLQDSEFRKALANRISATIGDGPLKNNK